MGGQGMTNRELIGVEMRVVGQLFVDRTRRWLLTVVGFALVAVGIAGLVLPVLPGWALIIAGFVVLSREYSWANSALAWARRQAAKGGRSVRDVLRRLRRRPQPVATEVMLPRGDVLIDLTSPPQPERPRQPQSTGQSERSA